MSLWQLYTDVVPTLSLLVSFAAVWYARDKAVREAQALPLKEAYDELWNIKNCCDPLYLALGLDKVVSLEYHTDKSRFPNVPDLPPELGEAIAKLRVSKKNLISPSGQRMDSVLASAEALERDWKNLVTAATRDLENHTAQTLGWNFGILERQLEKSRNIVDRYIEVLSEITQRKLLHRWYYKRHWPAVQRVLNTRIHTEDGTAV